ncbi:hypothetical protein ABK040_002768 [Willaertia magna]
MAEQQQTVEKLFTPLTLGPFQQDESVNFKLPRIQLEHRVVMAPLTRCRAVEGECVLTQHAVNYYQQRASKGGLLISEATQVHKQGQGYPNTPGIYSNEQIEAWKKVTEAVHSKGGVIALQLWHVGRIRYRDSISSSDIGLETTETTSFETFQNVKPEKPKAATIEEIKEVIQLFGKATKNAIEAGFDMVEIHAANGYLINQFIDDSVNKRTDEYGGSVENRLRLLKEVVEECVKAFNGESHRVAVRLSPNGKIHEMGDSDPLTTYGEAVKLLSKYNLGYVHFVEPRFDDLSPAVNTETFKALFNGPVISAGGYNRESAIKAVENGNADLIAFGRYFISTPDLVRRLKENLKLNDYNRDTFYYSPDLVTGYTDYKFYDEL